MPKYQTHVWLARVGSRTVLGVGCPACAATGGKGGRPKGNKRDEPAAVVDLLPRGRRIPVSIGNGVIAVVDRFILGAKRLASAVDQ
jgi:hypothetical protein